MRTLKKGVGLVLCLALLTLWSAGFAAAYTLPEKLHKQLSIGSGLKGSFVIRTEGANEWVSLLAPYAGAEYQVRGILSGSDLHCYLYQTDAEENQWAKTELYRKEDNWYLRSDALPDRVYSWAGSTGLADTLLPAGNVNPSLSSAFRKLSRLSAEDVQGIWAPLLRAYEDRTELWLQQYAAEPVVRRQEDGKSVMDLAYSVPAAALKEGILGLMREAVKDETLLTAMKSVMTEAQLSTYLNGDLMYFYEEALKQLNLEMDITLNRTVSTLGETYYASAELPLDAEKTGWDLLTIENSEGQNTYTLKGPEKTVSLSLPAGQPLEDEYTQRCSFTQYPEETAENPCQPIALRADITVKKSESTDEENRSHEYDHYTVNIQQDLSLLEGKVPEDTVAAFDPITAELELHYSSKYDNRSPTTVAFDLTCAQREGSARVYGSVKSASPWVFSPFAVENTISLTEMKPEEWLALGAQWLAGTAAQVKANAPAEEAAQTTESTVTPVPALEPVTDE